MPYECCSVNTLFVLLCGHTCCDVCIPKNIQKCKDCEYKFFYDSNKREVIGFKKRDDFVNKWQRNCNKLLSFIDYMQVIRTQQEALLNEAACQLEKNHEWNMEHTVSCDPQFTLDFFLQCQSKVTQLNEAVLENNQFLRAITGIAHNFNVFLRERTKELKADYTIPDQSFSKVLFNAINGFTLVVYNRFDLLNKENIPFENIVISKYNFCVTSESLVLNKLIN